MIYFILILFFSSLISIIFMIGRKLVLIKNGRYEIVDEASFEIPYIKEVKDLTFAGIKKYEHLSLVFIVKSYFQFLSFLKKKYADIKIGVKNIHIKKYPNGELIEKIESSKVVKFVSDYKHRIKEIVHKVKEEEKDL